MNKGRMLCRIVSGLIFIIGVNFMCSAQTESITITTYYPSPHGVYDELSTNKLAVDVTGVGVPTEFNAMNDGDVHIGRSLIVGAGGGSGFAYDEEGVLLRDGDVLIKGNVGIGTPNPIHPLHLYGVAVTGEYIQVQPDNAGNAYLWIDSGTTNNYSYLRFLHGGNDYWDLGSAGSTQDFFLQNRVTGNTVISVKQNGNVGIGTTNPGTSRLRIIGGTYAIYADGNDFGVYGEGANWGLYGRDSSDGTYGYIGWGNWGGYFSGAGYFSGNVGIGTTTPGVYKLYVNGNMYVNGDITTDANTYPDYVFEPNYEVMSIKNLKKFVLENKHLPGVPSAEEVKERGVKLFEYNRVLLEKLEETYLYIFELEERIAKLENKVNVP